MQARLISLRRGKQLLLRPTTQRICAGLNISEHLRLPVSGTLRFQAQIRHVCSVKIDPKQYDEHNSGFSGEQTIRGISDARVRKVLNNGPKDEIRPPKTSRKSKQVHSHRARTRLPTPGVLLGQFLDIRDVSARKVFLERISPQLNSTRLPSILLNYFHEQLRGNAGSLQNDTNAILRDISTNAISESAADGMRRRHLTNEEVGNWAWILSGRSADEMIDRFVSSPNTKPQFILAEILRRDVQYVRSLSKVFRYLLSTRPSLSISMRDLTPSELNPRPAYLNQLHENAFGVLISRLLYQARRIWPSSMATVAHMIRGYFESMLVQSACDEKQLPRISRLTTMLNYFIELLSLPAVRNPLSSARHNWKAQRVLLELAGSFDPPILLSQNGYRSIVKTVLATQKTDAESKSALLRTRSWPPWRRDQDGMDAKRMHEADLSRPVSAISKMQEAGFRLQSVDEVARIYGGMEADGTPTIQTRKMMRKTRSHTDVDPMSSQLWASRIEATRDVQEAWSAFLEFQRRKGKLSQGIFLAMFEKIESQVAGANRKSHHTYVPGDGKEVLPVVNVNFTDYYIQRFQAPNTAILYREMLDAGIRPSGRCLEFLIKKARTTDEGLRYVLDAGINESAVTFLAGTPMTRSLPDVILAIPERVLFAYIQLVCRLAPRIVTKQSAQSKSSSTSDEPLADRGQDLVTTADQVYVPSIWKALKQSSMSRSNRRQRETFKQVSFLLQKTAPMFRPSWYAYFRALARAEVLIPKQVVGNHQFDSLAWLRLAGTLKDFHANGLELDPEGFLYICITFEKFAATNFEQDVSPRIFGPGNDARSLVTDGLKILKSAFTQLSDIQTEFHEIPSLLYAIRGAHLHAYIRALGAASDHEGVLATLGWMVEHNEQLKDIAEENKNGVLSYEKGMVAARYFLGGTQYEGRAQSLVDKVSWWGGWPSDEQVVSYVLAPHHDLGGENSNEEDAAPKSAVKYPTYS